MKTLILNGSPRKNGDTVFLINSLIERLEGECKIVNTYYSNISPCIDCRVCRKQNGCVLNDDMNEIYRYIEDCDNIVIASPIYFCELTGRILDIASRLQTYFSAKLFRGEAPLIKPKKGAVILCGGGSGGASTAYNTASLILRHINTIDIFRITGSFNTDKLPACEDKKAVEEIFEVAEFLNGK